MPQFSSNSLDPDVSDALWAALSSIRYAKSMITAYGEDSIYARLQKITDELKHILGETEAAAAMGRVSPLSILPSVDQSSR
jgi:hypothetical protein